MWAVVLFEHGALSGSGRLCCRWDIGVSVLEPPAEANEQVADMPAARNFRSWRRIPGSCEEFRIRAALLGKSFQNSQGKVRVHLGFVLRDWAVGSVPAHRSVSFGWGWFVGGREDCHSPANAAEQPAQVLHQCWPGWLGPWP
jgi:hypothetical protein